MIYETWGFDGSPFCTTALPASSLGSSLLVGRETEVLSLMRKITSPPKLATVEGLNGVGKTSVANVASYRLFESHVAAGKGPLLVPCRKVFQLVHDQDIQAFIDAVLMEVAQTLIERADELKHRGVVGTKALDRWMNSPQLTTYSGGAWVLQAGVSSETNTSVGFERSGFRKTVLGWLETLFPSQSDGGVVCIIDNLELLQSSETARSLLEQLRDELFNVSGLRWILCGALGIVYGVVSSPRLEGYLHKPIEVLRIDPCHAADVLTSRIAVYKDRDDAYLPLLSSDFAKLYDVLNGNLRSVLSYADDYCQWVADRKSPETPIEKHTTFVTWLREQVNAAYTAVQQEVRPRAMKVFDEAVACGGIFSPSDYVGFGFNSIPAMRPHIRDLEAVGLLVSAQDDADKRRKMIQVTPKGWMVHLARAGTA